jgi:SAM-dependent methyltransferase
MMPQDEFNTARDEEWHFQWSAFSDDDQKILKEWIRPFSIEEFQGQDVLECGCGGGHHTAIIAPIARSVTAIDLNTASIARQRCSSFTNVEFHQDDVEKMDLGRQFDVVICIGVIHHTNNPDAVFNNLYRHCKPGGTIIVWTYSAEGNALVRYIVEPIRKVFLSRLPRQSVVGIARIITMLLYPIVHTIYRLPFLKFLPYFEYFKDFREFPFRRNVLNVFDKLNAPQTTFTTRSKCDEWFNLCRFKSELISIRRYAGTSYSLVGVKINSPS